MNNLRKIAVALATIGALGFSTSVFADAAISNGMVSAGINDGGTFKVDPGFVSPPGAPGLSYGGVEIINIDNPSSWWRLSSDTVNMTAQYNSNPDGATTTGVGSTAALTLGSSVFNLNMSWQITTLNRLAVSVQITNLGSTAMNDIAFGVGFDPDQARYGSSGSNDTLNRIIGQGSDAAVQSSAYNAGADVDVYASLRNTTSAGAFDIRAFINSGDCCTAVDPSSVLSGPLQSGGYSTNADDSISLAYGIGTLASGQTATIGYEYVFTPIPEPEIYAMMGAGLALMGWVGRRRKLQLAA